MKASILNLIAFVLSFIVGIASYNITQDVNKIGLFCFLIAILNLAFFIVNRINETK